MQKCSARELCSISRGTVNADGLVYCSLYDTGGSAQAIAPHVMCFEGFYSFFANGNSIDSSANVTEVAVVPPRHTHEESRRPKVIFISHTKSAYPLNSTVGSFLIISNTAFTQYSVTSLFLSAITFLAHLYAH